jgi:hypothetical protein
MDSPATSDDSTAPKPKLKLSLRPGGGTVADPVSSAEAAPSPREGPPAAEPAVDGGPPRLALKTKPGPDPMVDLPPDDVPAEEAVFEPLKMKRMAAQTPSSPPSSPPPTSMPEDDVAEAPVFEPLKMKLKPAVTSPVTPAVSAAPTPGAVTTTPDAEPPVSPVVPPKPAAPDDTPPAASGTAEQDAAASASSAAAAADGAVAQDPLSEPVARLPRRRRMVRRLLVPAVVVVGAGAVYYYSLDRSIDALWQEDQQRTAQRPLPAPAADPRALSVVAPESAATGAVKVEGGAGDLGDSAEEAVQATTPSSRAVAAEPTPATQSDLPSAVRTAAAQPTVAPVVPDGSPALAELWVKTVQFSMVADSGPTPGVLYDGLFFRPGDIIHSEYGLRVSHFERTTRVLVIVAENGREYGIRY